MDSVWEQKKNRSPELFGVTYITSNVSCLFFWLKNRFVSRAIKVTA